MEGIWMKRSQNHTATPKTPPSKRPVEGRTVFPGRLAPVTGGFPRSVLLVLAVVLALAPLRALAEAPAAPANRRAVFEDGENYIRWDHPGDPDISGYDWRFRCAGMDFWTPDWTVLQTADVDTVSVGLESRPGPDSDSGPDRVIPGSTRAGSGSGRIGSTGYRAVRHGNDFGRKVRNGSAWCVLTSASRGFMCCS
ncbi:MAG: hypothetical protein OXE86_17185 [Alphaproteobacteria bacterium]|nr:hypothetical protein [Alphaproteobacteria bacterium]